MTSIVKLLLSDMPKSEIDVKGGRAKSTPLHVACFRGQTKVVELLLEAGADPNTTNSKGESCLYWARDVAVQDYVDIYELLLKYGAKDEKPTRANSLAEMATRNENVHDENHYGQI
jgi:ankyrin repeat protein